MMNKDLLEAKLLEISNVIKREYINEEHIGLISGLSGMALFQFYYSKYLDHDDNANFGAQILSHIVEKINQGSNSPLYSNGIAGFGWTLDFLELNEFIEVDSDEILKDLDDYLITAMIANFNEGNYDFLHGSIGQAYYLFYRFRNTKSVVLKEKYETILFEFISFLNNASETEEDRVKWISILTFQPIKKGYNLCLSHGMSSIISILSKLYKESAFRDEVAPLLKGAINYIIYYKNTQKEAYCMFPNWITKEGEPEVESRLAWCYGDLGIGTALLQAAKALNEKSLKEEAIAILKHTTLRRTDKSTKVNDAGVCHGAFGNALIYNRLYKETKEEIFKETFEFWINKGIEMGTFDDGFAGYKMWNPDDKKWSKDTTLLNGIVGIGLTIITYLGDFESNWDECLMIN